jgi:squalene-hopene/tetraprenyl-beta-curcumene cyclase
VPLWFGNERAPREENPTYGTARVLLGLDSDFGRAAASSTDCRRRGLAWLLEAQNADGGWGGDCDVRSSIEETGLALAALCHDGRKADVTGATDRAAQWLARAAAGAIDPAPIGLYFANLWYSEDLYPLLFATLGLAAYRRVD